MYSVYCDSTLIYSDQSPKAKHKFIDGNLELEMNTCGTLEFTIPFTNAGYNIIRKMYSHITVYRNHEKIWGGRPVSMTEDFNKNRKFVCEGELAYLNDTFQPVHEYRNMTVPEFVAAILAVHNKKCDRHKKKKTVNLLNSVSEPNDTNDSNDPEEMDSVGDGESGSGSSEGSFGSETESERISTGTFRRAAYEGQDYDNVGWVYLKIVKGARYDSRPYGYIDNSRILFATNRDPITYGTASVNTRTMSFSNTRVDFKCKPFIWHVNENGEYKKVPTYRYRICYGLSDGSLIKATKFSRNSSLSKTFSDVKVTQEQIDNNVSLVISLEIQRLDGAEITTTDIETLSTETESSLPPCYFKIKLDTKHQASLSIYEHDTLVHGNHRSKKIFPGAITVYDNLECEYRYTYFESTFDTLRKIVESLGGVIRIRTGDDGKLYLDYLREYVNINEQDIEFGSNLLDYTRSNSFANVCSVLLPLGKKIEAEERVGDPIKVDWVEASCILEDSSVVCGWNFYTSLEFQIEAKSHIYTYNTETSAYDITEYDNKLYYKGEQMNGYYMWMFYDRYYNPIGGHKADSNTRTEKHEEYWGDTVGSDGIPYISIPQGAAYVAFGWYIDIHGYNREGGVTPELSNRYAYHTPCSVRYRNADGIVWEAHATADKNNTLTYAANSYLVDQRRTLLPDEIDLVEPAHMWHRSLHDYIFWYYGYYVSRPIPVTEGEVYYLTGRMHRGYAFYAIYREDGILIKNDAIEVAAAGESYTDLEKHKIEIPAFSSYMLIAKIDKDACGVETILYSDYCKKEGDYETPDDYVTIASVNNGSLYLINEELRAEYGWIEKTVTFDTAETPEDLMDLASKYLTRLSYEDITIELSAFDMNLVNRNIEAFSLLDLVHCKSAPHGLDTYFPVTKMSIPFLDPGSQTLTLGEEARDSTLSGSTAVTEANVLQQLDDLPATSSVVKTAVNNATNIMNLKTNSYVVHNQDEILIMNAPSVDKATHLWRMNANGIAFSENGYNGPYNLAFTMDGSIVADRITTGFMHADRIRGGTLTLGGYDGVNGEFHMQNAKGKDFITMTKDGAQMNVSITQPYGFRTKYDDELSFGILNINNGRLYGCVTELNIMDSEDFANTDKWWDNYAFSFDDIVSITPITKLDLYAGWNVDVWGTELWTCDYFGLFFASEGSEVLNGIGMMNVPGIIWSYDQGFRIQFTSTNNKDYISWHPSGQMESFGFSGLEMVMDNFTFTSSNNIDMIAKDIVISSSDYHIYLGSGSNAKLLTGYSGTIRFTNGESLTIDHGFITDFSSPNPFE